MKLNLLYIISALLLNLGCTAIHVSIIPGNDLEYLIVYTNDTIPTKYNKHYTPTFDSVTGLYKYNVNEGDLNIYRGACSKLNNMNQCGDTVKKYLNFDYLKIVTESGNVYEAKSKDEIIQLFVNSPGNGSSMLVIEK